jgi:hypothetical protein
VDTEVRTPEEVRRLKRLLLSLPELGLRVNWLRDRLGTWPVETSAFRLDGLCEESERSDPKAREALLAVALFLANSGSTPLVCGLRAQCAEHKLLSLARMLDWRRSGPPVESPALEIPDYGMGRELTVGERRSLARRPRRSTIEKLLMDPHPLVIRQLLENPGLVEDDVLRLATQRPARGDALQELVASTHWLCRRRVRLALVLNPSTPPHISMPLVVVCNRNDLLEVATTTTVPTLLRVVARELLGKRPPLRRRDAADGVLQ